MGSNCRFFKGYKTMGKERNTIIIHGGAEESAISKISASYISEKITKIGLKSEEVNLNEFDNLHNLFKFITHNHSINDTYIIPCIHGAPGESGEIQNLISDLGFKFLGCNMETSINCFNKITTKLHASSLEIPVVPFKRVTISGNNYDKLVKSLKIFYHENNQHIFIKAPKQGSSIGCYEIKSEQEIEKTLLKCSKYGPEILVEKAVSGRELEVATFEFKSKLIISKPGEVLTSGEFYNFDKKYSNSSPIKTSLTPEIDPLIQNQLESISKNIFISMGIKDLSRIDFFLENKTNKIYLNEVNTFPGMTPISLFPKLMECSGVKFEHFLEDRISK